MMNNDDSNKSTFLLTANNRITAGAYEEMLKKNNVSVLLENLEPAGRYVAVMEGNNVAGRDANPVNLYVLFGQLERARELVEIFDNQPIVYNTPPPKLNQKSRMSQVIFALVIFLIIIVPIGISLFVLGDRIVRFFTR